MKELSAKATVVHTALTLMEATKAENKVTSYAIEDFIIGTEDILEHGSCSNIEEETYENIVLEINIKSINTILASLVRRGIVYKTEPSSVIIEGVTRTLRQYYLK